MECGVPGTAQRAIRFNLSRTAAAIVTSSAVLWPLDAARAACDPAAGPNVVATCTGVTNNQGPGLDAGYGNGGTETNATVTVVPGASVTGNSLGVAIVSGTIANSGTISGGFAGVAIVGGTVINSGTITSPILGIFSNVSVNVTNSGTIAGGLVGVAAGGTGNVTNSGIISGPIAIQFASSANTLTLLPGSKILGTIQLVGGGDTVNVRTGNQNLTFGGAAGLTGATVTSTAPFVVVGNQVVTIDPTAFAANGRLLGDFSRSVSQVVPSFGNRPAATGGGPIGYAAASVVSSAFDNMPGRDAYAADQAVFKAPTVVHADGTAVWARGFGGYRVQQSDGALLRTANTFYGGAIGIEKQVAYDLRVGAFAGGGATRSSIELNSGDTNSNLGFGGVYAHYFRGASFLYAAVQGGGSRNDVTRNNINNNLVANGLETAKGSYNGWYVSPELTLGHNVALGQVAGAQHTLTPSIGVRYLYGSFGGYTETGSTANLTVNSQTVQTLEERAELKLTRATLLSPDFALLIDVTAGALGVQRVGSNTVNAALLGQSIPFAAPGKDDVYGGFGGLGMEFRTANFAVFAAGEYLWLSDSSTVISGKGGVRVAF